jgi:hypothetical protein
MAADGMIGNGTKFAYSSSSPVSWTNIGQLLDINGLELVRDKIDRTVHTTNIQKRSLPGMAEVTDFECTVLSDPDESTTQGTVWWRLEIPVDRAQTAYKAFEFQGYVRRWMMGTAIEDRQEFPITISFDGDGISEYEAGASAI